MNSPPEHMTLKKKLIKPNAYGGPEDKKTKPSWGGGEGNSHYLQWNLRNVERNTEDKR